MAEHSPPGRVIALIQRRNGQVWVGVAALTFSGAVALGGPPPPALPPERARVLRGRVLGPAAATAPMRALARWLRLCLALPAIGTTPPSRSDTPALPTVGRPRDGPGSPRPLPRPWKQVVAEALRGSRSGGWRPRPGAGRGSRAR